MVLISEVSLLLDESEYFHLHQPGRRSHDTFIFFSSAGWMLTFYMLQFGLVIKGCFRAKLKFYCSVSN